MLNMKKRLFHALLSIALMFSMIPTVFAEGNETEAVAKIGETPYATLQEAVSEAKSGDIIQLVIKM